MDSKNLQILVQLLPTQTLNTLYMVFGSAIIAILIGLPIGVALTILSKGHLKENPKLYKVLDVLVNMGRSFPFAILMVMLIPVTRWIVGTSLGTTAAIVPLSVAAIPFFARLVEMHLKSVDQPILEAVVVMGSSPWQIITKVLIKEALPSLISATTLMLINLIGYSAMAGLIGGGGLGQVAIQYGYHRFNLFIMLVTVFELIVLVQGIQYLGDSLLRWVLKKRGIHD